MSDNDSEIDDHLSQVVKFSEEDIPATSGVNGEASESDDEPSSKPRRKRRRKKSPVRRRPKSMMLMDDDDDDDENNFPSHRENATAESKFRSRIDEDFDGLLTSLEFGTDNHKITVYRLEPSTDDDGDRIAGMLDTFHNGLEIEDIKKKYGGGTYKLTIMGPKRSTGRGNEIKASKQITIAGPPKIKGKDSGENNPLMVRMLENAKDDSERAHREAEKARDQMMNILTKDDSSKVLAPLLEFMKQSMDNSGNSLAPIMTMMQSQMASAEAKSARESEDRRREMDAADRRHDKEMLQEQQRHDTLMEQMKFDREAAAVAAKADREKFERQIDNNSSEKNNMLLSVMKMQSEMESNNRSRDKESQTVLFNMMQMGQKQSMEMAMQASSMQIGVLTETLKDARESKREKSDFQESMENMTALMGMQNLISGKDDDNRETWEKVLEKVGEMGPGLASAATSAFRGQAQRQPSAANPQITPGTVIMIDDNAATEVSNQLPEQTEKQKEPEQSKSILPDEVQVPDTQQLDGGVIDNDFTQLNFPSDGGENLVAGVTMLIKDIDFALRRDMEAEQIYVEVIEKFPAPIIKLIYGASEDDLIAVVETNVPDYWTIMSPRGESAVRDLYKIIKEKYTV